MIDWLILFVSRHKVHKHTLSANTGQWKQTKQNVLNGIGAGRIRVTLFATLLKVEPQGYGQILNTIVS